mmetsp:Transcript_37707/g.82832  ORF Transcript_37707/g.82832 Transcript_37707/m.82832 type:complete len:303 (-) Transcript_37707:54-962(-)
MWSPNEMTRFSAWISATSAVFCRAASVSPRSFASNSASLPSEPAMYSSNCVRTCARAASSACRASACSALLIARSSTDFRTFSSSMAMTRSSTMEARSAEWAACSSARCATSFVDAAARSALSLSSIDNAASAALARLASSAVPARRSSATACISDRTASSACRNSMGNASSFLMASPESFSRVRIVGSSAWMAMIWTRSSSKPFSISLLAAKLASLCALKTPSTCPKTGPISLSRRAANAASCGVSCSSIRRTAASSAPLAAAATSSSKRRLWSINCLCTEASRPVRKEWSFSGRACILAP